MESIDNPAGKFTSPHEEIAYLKDMIARRERELLEETPEASTEHIAREEVVKYAERKSDQILHDKYIVPTQEMEAIVLELSPEEHDEKMNELLGFLEKKGIHNTLKMVENMHDPHIYDDFHRLLVQYIRAGFVIGGLKDRDPLWRSLKMSLYEILVPEVNTSDKGGTSKPLKELLSSMEQFYAGMCSVKDKDSDNNVFAFEIAVANHSEDFIFYCAVPDNKRNLFEKQILSVFPDAKVTERKDDYNIFPNTSTSVASYAHQRRNHIFPLKTYDEFDHDPINAVLNSFSKINKDGEGASLQIVFKPVGDFYNSKYKKALEKIKKGEKLHEAIDIAYTTGDKVLKGIGKGLEAGFQGAFDLIGDLASGSDKKDDPKKKEQEDKKKRQEAGDKGMRPENEIASKEIEKKTTTMVLSTNIRIIASAKDESVAKSILSDLEAAFNQFEDVNGNGLDFVRVNKSKLQRELENFTYRSFDDDQNCPLSLKELATIMHMPVAGKISTSQVKLTKSGTSAAPLGLPQIGTLLGINSDRGRETSIYMTPEDRLRHFYVIGQTGTGKTTLLKNMILQDMQRGDGVCFIDPHGSDVEDILAIVPPERYGDVIYFDPAYTARPMALNMLEYDPVSEPTLQTGTDLHR